MTRLFRAFAAFWGLMIVSTGTPAIAAEGFSDTFQSHPVTGWHVADYAFSHPHFDTDWSRGQLRFENGVHLNLSPQANQTNRFTGASIRRENTTHYGRYEVVMKPARGVGVVTGFFTYTGAYYGTRHDEIDIEFLGKDTTSLHIAWFVDGVLKNMFIDLGFDAADAPRIYAFEWLPDRIRWYAEERLVFEVTEGESDLPSLPSFLFANIWAADESLDAWSGTPQANTHASAFVGEVRFIPLKDLPQPLS